MEELNGILWEERELLEDLLFALHTEEWVVSTGRSRWLVRAADQIHRASDRLRTTEVLRAAEADAAALAVGLPPAPSLASLAEFAGEPWRTIFLDQRAGLVAATGDFAGDSGPAGPASVVPPEPVADVPAHHRVPRTVPSSLRAFLA